MVRYTFGQESEYHYAEITGLKPSTRYWYQVESNGVRGSLNSFSTLPRPNGRRLFSFALFSDLHITYGDPYGDINEIFFGKLTEHSGELMVQSIFDSMKRNIDLAVLTRGPDGLCQQGSVPGTERTDPAPVLGELLIFYVPVIMISLLKTAGLVSGAFWSTLLFRIKLMRASSLRTTSFLLLDSCRQDDNWGYVEPGQIRWLRRSCKTAGESLPFVSAPPLQLGPDLWFGVKNYRELQQAIRPFPGIRAYFTATCTGARLPPIIY